jgi:general stress protein 26
VINDRDKIKELWSPILKAWFPKGIDDPDLALVECAVLEAEYWDASSSRMVQLFSMLKAAITGKEYDEGKHATLKL